MDKDAIMLMVQESGLEEVIDDAYLEHGDWYPFVECLAYSAFAAGVLAEREACAKVCDEFADATAKHQDFHALILAESIAEELRARGTDE